MSSRVYFKSIRYIAIKTKKEVCIEYNEFLFQHKYLRGGRGAVRSGKRNPLYPIRATFVSIVMCPTCSMMML
jgi:hypothetical protein